ncbi:hypothetical protein FQZ97_1104520 [compost metagenome]
MSMAPKRRPLSRMFCSSAGPLKPPSSREITLMTSTSSAGGNSLTLLLAGAAPLLRLLSAAKSSSLSANRSGSRCSALRFRSPCCTSAAALARLPRLLALTGLGSRSRSRADALSDGRSLSSSSGSLWVSSTRDGPSTSALPPSSSGRLE